MINCGLPGEESTTEIETPESPVNPPEQFSTPLKETNSLGSSTTKQAVATDDSESSIASGSDDEWKPSILKKERVIDPGKIIDITTAEEPLFAVKEIPEISDYDDDSPDNNSDCDVKVPQPIKKSNEPPTSVNSSNKKNVNSSTGAIKKKTNPVLSKLKPINICKNQDASRLIRRLVEYFTFHNSLPEREKHKHKHRLSDELMAVFSEVLNDCCNNIFLSVLESEEFQNSSVGKKVKTKSVACQTVISGDVLSTSLLTQTDGKISNDVNKSTKTDIETVIDLFNEYIAKMNEC